MRTADQIKRKYNELAARKKELQTRRETSEEDGAAIGEQLGRLEEQLLLLEWVLNEPQGSYHGHS
jgi:hypothetical protein